MRDGCIAQGGKMRDNQATQIKGGEQWGPFRECNLGRPTEP